MPSASLVSDASLYLYDLYDSQRKYGLFLKTYISVSNKLP
jgi:hypothetical protein